MPSSTFLVPEWKAKLLQKKKAEKLKIEQIPLWKRDLLLRLHAKNETIRNKQLLESARNTTDEDNLVINEHILKVSENIFIRMELERCIKSPPLSPKRTGFEHQQFQNGDLYAKELPSSGLVSRLKGKYAPSSGHRMSVVTPPSSIETTLTPVKFRSKSTIDAPSIGQLPDRNFTATRKPPQNNLVQENSSREDRKDHHAPVRKTSIDLITPKGFSRTPTHSATSVPFHKVTSPTRIKKFSAPVIPKRKTHPPSEDSVNNASAMENNSVVSSQASVIQKNGTNTKSEAETLSDCNLPNDECHDANAKTVENDHKNLNNHHDTAVTKREKPPLKSKPQNLISSFHQTNQSPKEKFVHKAPELTAENQIKSNEWSSDPESSAAFRSSSVGSPTSIPSSGASSPATVRSFGAGSPAAIRSTGVGSPATVRADGASNHSTSDTGSSTTLTSNLVSESRVKTWFDSPLSKADTRSEINKPTKDYHAVGSTFPEERTASSPSPAPSTNSTYFMEPKSDMSISVTDKDNASKDLDKNAKDRTSHSNRILSQSKPQETSPKTQTDMFIAPQDTKSAIVHQLSSNIRTNVSGVNSITQGISSETKFAEKPAEKKGMVFGNASCSNSVSTPTLSKNGVENKASNTANASEKSFQQLRDVEGARDGKGEISAKKELSQTSPNTPVRRKLSGPGVLSAKGFGGTTFMIDPSKFKKAAPNSPSKKSQETPASTGKRKLRADQIVVIGGYVKLERSSLMRSQRVREKTHVKFMDTLESVFNYPSEKSLLQEVGENDEVIPTASHAHLLPSKRDSQLDNVTAKALLAMKQEDINSSDEEN